MSHAYKFLRYGKHFAAIGFFFIMGRIHSMADIGMFNFHEIFRITVLATLKILPYLRSMGNGLLLLLLLLLLLNSRQIFL